MTDLSSYTSVGTILLAKIVIPSYQTIAFSDYNHSLTVDSIDYDELGSLLSVSPVKSEIKGTTYDLSLSITGLLSSNVTAAMNTNLKGSTIEIRKIFYNPANNEIVGSGTRIPTSNNIVTTDAPLKFEGIINNVGFKENFNSQTGTSDFILTFICSSNLSVLLKQTRGRRTNPVDEAKFFPTDTAFSRVPEIRNSNFNFGAPDTIPRVGTK
jgi:hypothetical protein